MQLPLKPLNQIALNLRGTDQILYPSNQVINEPIPPNSYL
jgi:hypothetical protein